MNSLKLSVIFLCSAFLASACQSTANNSSTAAQSGPQTETAASNQAAAARIIGDAKEVYATNCMICHKESGKGGPVTIDGKKLKPDDLTSEKIKTMTDEKLIGYVTNGVVDEGMPAFKDKLSTEEIRMAVAHVRRLQGP